MTRLLFLCQNHTCCDKLPGPPSSLFFFAATPTPRDEIISNRAQKNPPQLCSPSVYLRLGFISSISGPPRNIDSEVLFAETSDKGVEWAACCISNKPLPEVLLLSSSGELTFPCPALLRDTPWLPIACWKSSSSLSWCLGPPESGLPSFYPCHQLHLPLGIPGRRAD